MVKEHGEHSQTRLYQSFMGCLSLKGTHASGRVHKKAVCIYIYLSVCLLSTIPVFLYRMVSVTCKQVIAPVVLLL